MPDFGLDILRNGYSDPTSLQFLTDDAGTVYLITTQQNGNIAVSIVTSSGEGVDKTYDETTVFETGIINTILNHNDDGSASGTTGRQVTGFHARFDENGDIELYVTSSDPRIGGGGEANVDDKNLDTNSGVLSKVTLDIPEAGDWSATKIDLLRGIPRSEENHSVNGVDFTPDGNLLMMVGGFANAGAPSQNLVYTPEYFLSGSMLEVDIEALEALPTLTDSEGQSYKYNLPTLGIQRGDEGDTRPGAGYSSLDDAPWGGNDGYNQAYLEADGPVNLFASGFRNGYDVEVVELEAGDIGYSAEPGADNFRVYVWDNGANNGWGEAPSNAAGQTFSTDPSSGELAIHDDGEWKDIVIQENGDVFVEENGTTGVFVEDGSGGSVFLAADRPDNIPLDEDNTPISPGAQDNLHFVERGGYYGSPNISQANPDAKLYLKPEIEGGGEDGDAVVAPEFETMSLRDYLPAELGGDPLNGFEPSPLTGFYIKPKLGGGPIDDALVLNGGSTNGIVVYEYIAGLHPESMAEFDGDLFATGFDEQIIRVDLSEDGRTALNRADIESNGAFQDSPGGNPLDVTIGPDGTIWVAAHGAGNIFGFVADGLPIEDTANDDSDQLFDAFDPFQLDALNGLGSNSKVSAGEVFEFTMENEVGAPNGLTGFVLGFTGHMVNYTTEYFTNQSGVVAAGVLDGGIAGKLQIEFDAVGDGSAEGTDNDVTYALQAGVNFDDTSKRILLESEISNVWTDFNQEAGQSQGIYFGTGTQFDFATFNFAINDNGDEVVRVYIELNDEQVFLQEYAAPGMTDVSDEDLVMRVIIDREEKTVQAIWEYATDGGPVTGQSAVIDLDSFGENNLSEAIVGAGQGGFLAREAPENGERGDAIFSNLTTDVFVDLGLAVGVTGRVETTNAEGGLLFTPEFDNLLITASDEQGDFAANVNDEIAGSVAFGETLIVDVAALLANDSSFQGGTLSITSVQADGDGTATLINGGTQVSYTPNSINDTGFTYTVADSAGGAIATAMADVNVTLAPGTSQVLYRVNAGSGTVAAVDDGPDWIGDTTTEGAAFISSTSASNPYTQDLTNAEDEMDLTFLENQDDIPWQLFTHERGDTTSAGNLEYAFDVTEGSTYAVTLYYVENWNGIFGSAVPRVFDVAVNGTVPPEFDDLNPVQEAADALGLDLPAADASNALKQPLLGTAFSKTIIVTADSEELLLEFLAGTQNPKINAIEISEISPLEPGLSVSISDGMAIEGDAVLFTLDASDTPDEMITITYEIVPGTAQPDVDYDTGGETPDENGVITGTATIAATSTDGSIVINTIGNDSFQGDRDFTVNITDVSGAGAVIGSASADGTITEDDEAVAGDVVSAVNAGAAASIDGAAFNVPGTFETDTNAAVNPVFTAFNTAKTNNNGADDAADYVGDLPNDIFFSERWAGTLSYDLAVENGDYIVELYFAETFVGVGTNTSGVGARIFDVNIEDDLVLDDYDLFDDGDGILGNGAGAALTQIVKTYVVNVDDGNLDIDFAASVDNAKISAIIVREVADDTAPSTDIDEDGILNTDDPFAYDGTNGDAKVLTAGGEFLQDFNTDSADPFSAEGGFSGIIVNQLVDQAGSSETDPYGDRTTESGVNITDGVLNVTSSNTDLFNAGVGEGDGANNQIKDNYHSAADVTGVDTFEVVARTQNPFAGDGAPALTSFASFGITLGAGGVDDYIKFVLGGSGSGPRVQLGQEGSLTGAKEENLVAAADAPPANPVIDITEAPEIEFKLLVDQVAGTVQGVATFFDDLGVELGVISTSVRTIDPAGSFAAALNGENPLTGGDGGIAYGISITDWGGAGEFVGTWDSLAIRSLDTIAVDALVSIAGTMPVVEAGDEGTTALVFDVTTDDGFSGDLEVAYTADTGAGPVAATETVTFVDGAGTITVTVENDDIDNGDDLATVVLTGVTTEGYSVDATAATASNTVTEDEFNTPFTEAADGDLSDDNLAPTDIKTALGDNLITASQQGNPEPTPDDQDFFTITIEEGQVLDAIILDGLTIGDDAAFIGFMAGDTFDADIAALEAETVLPSTEGLLGGYVYGPEDVGSDLLENMNDAGLFQGFTLPLPAGTYTFWMNQNGPASEATLNFQISEPDTTPPTATVTLDAVDTTTDIVVEIAFDEEVTGLEASEVVLTGPSGALADGVLVVAEDGLSATVTYTVPVDGFEEGAYAATLQSGAVQDGASLDNVEASSASVEISDFVPVFRGELLGAFNAGGPELVQDGITFAAAPSDVAPFAGTAQYSDQTNGNGEQSGLDGTVWETELNGAPDGDFTFDLAVASDSVYVDLYLAELFQSTEGARVFDVIVEGVTVLDNYDIFAVLTEGVDLSVEGALAAALNQGLKVELPGPITVGEDGTLNIQVVSSVDGADRGAIQGIAVYAAETDETAPTATVVVDAQDIETDIVVELSFDEPVTGLEASEVTLNTPDGPLTNGALVVAENGLSATVTFAVPVGGFTIGDYTASLVSEAVQDRANLGNAEANSLSVAVGEPIEIVGRSEIKINEDGASLFTDSTYGGGSIQIENQSDEGLGIATVTIDLSTTLIPATVFDPATDPVTGDPLPAAGDATNKDFDFSVPLTVGLAEENVTVAYAAGQNPGFFQMILTFEEGSFLPADLLAFSIDIDPDTAFSPLGGGAVSGMELAGATFTVEYENGDTSTGAILADSDGTTGATGYAESTGSIAAPTITFGDGTVDPLQVTDAELPVLIDAGIENAGATVRVYVQESAFYEPSGGAAPADFVGNNANALSVSVDVVLDENGQYAGPVTITRTDNEATGLDDSNLGINAIAAAIVGPDGNEGLLSAPLIAELIPLVVGRSEIKINEGGTNLFGDSTYGGGSIQLENQSDEGLGIATVTIDLSTNLIPATVFDPATDPVTGDPLPAAGDAVNKDFDFSALSVGLSEENVSVAYAAGQEPGFFQMILTFEEGSFLPEDLLAFSIDIDPDTAFSPLGGGAVSGMELAGATFTVEYENGDTSTGAILADSDGTTGASGYAESTGSLAAPIITFGDGSADPMVVSDAEVPVLIDAGIENAGATVRVYVQESAFYEPNGGDAPADFVGNNANAFSIAVDIVLDEFGQYAGPITVTRTDNEGTDLDDANLGINAIAAAIVGPDGNEGLLSSPLTVELVPVLKGRTEVTINEGSSALFSASTFTANSIQIDNQSTGLDIASISFDLSSTLIPATVFDPLTDPDTGEVLPPAGDSVNKDFDFGGATVGLVEEDITVSFGAAQTPGFFEMMLEFEDGSFGSGDLLAFGIDIDPDTAFSPLGGGAVSGMELTGATFTVTYSDGSTATGTILSNTDETVTAVGVADTLQDLNAPTLTLGDGTTAPVEVDDPSVPILIDAGVENAGATARIFILESAFYDPNGAPAPEDFVGNNANAFAVSVDVVLDASGQYSGPVTVTRTDNQDTDLDGSNLGINSIAVALVDANGDEGPLSSPLTVELAELPSIFVATPQLENFLATDSADTFVFDAPSSTTAAIDLISGIGLEDTIDLSGTGLSLEDLELRTVGGGTILKLIEGFNSSEFQLKIDLNGLSQAQVLSLITFDGEPEPNNPPVANADALEVDAGAVGSINVLLNDTDLDGDTLSIDGFSQGTGGTVTDLGNGVLQYTPNADFVGDDSFTYTISDPDGDTSMATVSVSVVVPVNDPPMANDDTASTNVNEAVSVNVLSNDTDPENDDLSIDSFEQGSNGSVEDLGNGVLEYTPNEDFEGNDSFTYTISDEEGLESIATVNISVAAVVDDPPTANNDSASTDVNEAVSVNVLANDTDPENGDLSLDSFEQGANGTVADLGNGVLEYTPNDDFIGGDSFTYTISDEAGQESTATVNVTVEDPDAFNVIAANVGRETLTGTDAADAFVFAPGTSINGDIDTVANWAPGDVIDLTGLGLTADDIEVRSVSGGATLKLIEGFGSGDFQVRVNVNGFSQEEVLNSVIYDSGSPPPPPPPTAPDAENDAASTSLNTATTINVLANDSDVNDDALSVSDFTDPDNGSVQDLGDGNLQYTPNLGFIGTDTFTYTVSDGGLTTDATVSVTVTDPDAFNVVNATSSVENLRGTDGPDAFTFAPGTSVTGAIDNLFDWAPGDVIDLSGLGLSEGDLEVRTISGGATIKLIEGFNSGDFQVKINLNGFSQEEVMDSIIYEPVAESAAASVAVASAFSVSAKTSEPEPLTPIKDFTEESESGAKDASELVMVPVKELDDEDGTIGALVTELFDTSSTTESPAEGASVDLTEFSTPTPATNETPGETLYEAQDDAMLPDELNINSPDWELA